MRYRWEEKAVQACAGSEMVEDGSKAEAKPMKRKISEAGRCLSFHECRMGERG